MTRIIAVLAASTALAAAALPASAADLYEPVPVAPVDPGPVANSAFDWTGAYIGGAVGYNFTNADIEFGGADGDRSLDGISGGIYAGYNYALSNGIVLGAEADLNLAEGEDIRFAGTPVDFGTMTSTTARARVGYAFDNFMVYGTGGLAVGFTEASFNGGTDNATHVGYVVGAGVEAALTDNLIARAEYLYTDLGSETYRSGGAAFDADLSSHTVRAGLAYKF